MEETIQFIYREIRNHRVNTGGQIDDIFPIVRIAKQNPIIKNNYNEAIEQLVANGILEKRDNTHFLTELGFNTIYNQ